MKNDFQTEWNELQEIENSLKKQLEMLEQKKSIFYSKTSENGYVVINNQVLVNEPVYIFEYDFSILHSSRFKDEYKGAVELSPAMYQSLRDVFFHYGTEGNKLMDMIQNITNAPARFYEDEFDRTIIHLFDEDDLEKSDDYLLEWYSYRGNVESFINVTKQNRSAIASKPHVYNEKVIR